jgi:hypothetical protein
MAKKTTNKGLGNPLALATASTVLNSKEGQKTIGQTLNAVKILFLLGGVYLAGSLGWKQYKLFRAKKYANENIGHPNLIFATIMRNSFTHIGFKDGILSYIFSEISIATDEATLYDLASKVTDIKGVSDAYNILFDRNLSQDLQEGLDNKEAQRFWKILNSEPINTDATMYGTNLRVYAAVKGAPIRVNTAIKKNGKWQGTNESYGNFNNNEFVGTIIANGVHTFDDGRKENYYIVEEDAWKDWNGFNESKKGVVLQHQITDIKN